MGFKRILLRVLFGIVLLFVFTGCGDLEPDMQDTRTVNLNMDFHSKSSSRSSSSVSAAELSQYNTHLILALPSWEYLTSNYRIYYSSFAQELMNTADKKVGLEIPLNTQMKIFAFLFKDTYTLSDLISGYQEVGYYGESQPFSIDAQTNDLSLGISLIQVPGTDTGTDTTAPVLTELTAVSSPTSDSTPDYTFKSTEAGTISYGGSCSSSTTAAVSGDNNIRFNYLTDGYYEFCTITVKDSEGYISNTLAVTPFIVDTTTTDDTTSDNTTTTTDTTAPVLTEVTAVSSPTSDSTPDYSFKSTEAGNISYGGLCSSNNHTDAISGDNIIIFDYLNDGNYPNCTITVTDSAGNISNTLHVTTFIVDTTTTDTTAPVIETVTAVTTPTSIATPDYTFSSTESGSITYGGPCATAGSATTNAIVGHNLIIFNTLSDGSYINCTITVTDPAGNESTTLQIPDFTVQTISTLPAPDNLTASGTSTSVTLKWNAVTDASSYTLYWDNVSGIDSSDNTFNNITNDNYTHNNLDNGTTYYYKVAAVNSSGTGTLSSEKIYITNLWDGLVAHYPFNGNANNVKGNYNGTVNGATMSTGRGNDNNTAYSFDGANDYIDFGSGILSGNGSFTIVVSINSTTTSSRILQQRDAQGFNGQYMLDILDNGSIKFKTYYFGDLWNVTSSSALNDGSWHHLAFVQKDDGGQMYLNGILEQTDNTGGKVKLTSSLKTYIGGDLRDSILGSPPKWYTGKIDDLKIYSRALSASEIQTLYNIID